MKILLSGATGFIGSNISNQLLRNGYDVYATHRNTSSFEKCSPFFNQINWINTDKTGWKEEVKALNPDQLIHAAWEGIEVQDRNNWSIQIRNFWFSKEYFDLAKECEIKRIIALGSQAEYGIQDIPVTETTVPRPNDAYGAVKTLTANYLRNLFEGSSTEWYWIRVFSVFGNGENSKSLIPMVITRLLKNEPVKLTSCEQRYNYLHIDDFVASLLKVVESKGNKSGIYNICHSRTVVLKDLLLTIADLLNVDSGLLLFRSLPQRIGQNMLIEGDNSKFRNCFEVDNSFFTDMTSGLTKSIQQWRNKVL
jgi:nucleoside-diphosphate-sugar epimerase